MVYLVTTDLARVPVLSEYPDDGRHVGYPTKELAVDAYVASIKLSKRDFLVRINRNMNRVASADRKIRMALKLKE